MTFSIAAKCEETGRFGVAIASSSPAVAARCAHLRPTIGAACTQNITDPRLGGALLDAVQSGLDARAALDAIVAAHGASIHYRQLTVVDSHGATAAWSGDHCLGVAHTVAGEMAVAAGNLLAHEHVPAAMIDAFAARKGAHLGDRLVGALAAGLAAGGESGPVHSAGLIIVDQVAWPTTDLRVDWSDRPIAELEALWRLWRPQIDAYLARALDPADSPGYAVPGDDR
jgi:uncharacterized Ntn-hydrolase superfamily protein